MGTQRVPGPSKNHSFLVLVAGFAGHEHQKIESLGRRCLPKPHHRISPVIEDHQLDHQRFVGAAFMRV